MIRNEMPSFLNAADYIFIGSDDRYAWDFAMSGGR